RRESAARRPEPDRGGSGLSKAPRRVRMDTGGASAADRKGSHFDRELSSTVAPPGGDPGRPSKRPAHDGSRARAARVADRLRAASTSRRDPDPRLVRPDDGGFHPREGVARRGPRLGAAEGTPAVGRAGGAGGSASARLDDEGPDHRQRAKG